MSPWTEWFTNIKEDAATGISDPTAIETAPNVPDFWYTLDGRRIAKPTQRGLYIHGGRKGIVK